ncbi:biotin carboxylase [bacterium (Candidatus Blackallbacteria) CG18_big_fil_WC_8_21_14_2_50_49_26]|nr:MAG: biotin carboxylase [bacterium (Candidatus Blackallbacteria) CG18_big_fil_WC_8_21_14_2_50_49_26]
MKFDHVLVANRSVIGRRIVRTCREMGLKTTSVFTCTDLQNAWLAQADQAIEIPDLPDCSGYMNAKALLKAAKELNAAIHPGYGFLSERADFRKLCDSEGIELIGPSFSVLELAGDKVACQAFLAKQGLPLIPSLAYPEVQGEKLITACQELGYPLMLKPARGGGGLGMLKIESQETLMASIEQATAYAQHHFQDPTLLIEKYLKGSRHVEVQILADRHGNLTHLYERECSLQRRRQKVIEEAPAVFLSESDREKVWNLALEIAQIIGIDQVSTIEFLWHEGNFYFLEINPRLQVEHAVSEEICAEDLVAWQIRIAQGESLENFSRPPHSGHSIEARIYAENPDTGLPSTGQIEYIQWPLAKGLRIESGIGEGSQLSVQFDPLVCKLISHADNRELARKQLVRALKQLELAGTVYLNTPVLLKMLETEAYIHNRISTEYYSSFQPRFSKPEFWQELLLQTEKLQPSEIRPQQKPFRNQTGFWRPAFQQ